MDRKLPCNLLPAIIVDHPIRISVRHVLVSAPRADEDMCGIEHRLIGVRVVLFHLLREKFRFFQPKLQSRGGGRLAVSSV